MSSFFIFISIFLAIIFIGYFAAKAIKYIAYSISNAIAKGVYDARNGVVIEEKKKESVKEKSTELVLGAEPSNLMKCVRRSWRSALITYYLGNVALVLIVYFLLLSCGESSASEYAVESITTLILLGISLSILSYFAYVKCGTKWLLWFLVVSPIRTGVDAVNELTEIFKNIDMQSNWFMPLLIICFSGIALFINFWFHSKQLYHLNIVINRVNCEKKDLQLEPIQAAE